MSLRWIPESPPYWDAPKAALVGDAPPGIFDVGNPARGDLLPGDWWRVESDAEIVGYGWMDTTWGDAEILLVVAPAHQRRGVGEFILSRLDDEARSRGLNYLFNTVRPTHPDRPGITRWLEKHGFTASKDRDLLRRAVKRNA